MYFPIEGSFPLQEFSFKNLSTKAGFGIWGVQLHAHASAHAQNIKDAQKKHALFD